MLESVFMKLILIWARQTGGTEAVWLFLHVNKHLAYLEQNPLPCPFPCRRPPRPILLPCGSF